MNVQANDEKYELFLKEYVDEMSDAKSDDIEGCIKETLTNARLKPILILYLLSTGFPLTGTHLEEEWLRIGDWLKNGEALPRAYEKVLQNYEVRSSR